MSTKTYINQRGRQTVSRPMRDLDAEERELILADLLSLGAAHTKTKWNISTRTLAHLKFHYREALAELEDENFRKAGI